MIGNVTDWLLGEKVANSETRHRRRAAPVGYRPPLLTPAHIGR